MRLLLPEVKRWLDVEGYRDIRVFVETGTDCGLTTSRMAPWFARVFTVDGSAELLCEAVSNYAAKHPNICWLLGASPAVVRNLAAILAEPVCWFLDAHYFARVGVPAWAGNKMPLFDELAALRHRRVADVVIVDDYRFFGRVKRGMDWRDVTLDRVLDAAGRETIKRCDNNADRLVIYRRGDDATN